MVFNIYLLCVWIIVFLFYNVTLNAFCEALRHYNRELKYFGEKDEKIEKLSQLYDKQVNLMALLRKMNSTFEVVYYQTRLIRII
jgi:hypothetical protein